MALPSSGQISILDVANETGLSPVDLSLRSLSNLAGKSSPDALSEFYNYDQNDIERYMNAIENTGYSLNATEISAIDTLFTDIDAAGIYNKIYGFYPMIGPNVNTQRINAKSENGKRQWGYDLSFSGGWTFGSSGATGNGSNTAWVANYNGYNTTTLRFSHLGTYITIQDPFQNYGWDIGIFDNSSTYPYAFAAMYEQNANSSVYDYDYSDGVSYWAVGNTAGNSTISYYDATADWQAHQNGNLFLNKSSGTETITGTTYVVGGYDYYYNTYTSNTFGFITFGENLTDTETVDYQAAINTFQTTLGRNVY